MLLRLGKTLKSPPPKVKKTSERSRPAAMVNAKAAESPPDHVTEEVQDSRFSTRRIYFPRDAGDKPKPQEFQPKAPPPIIVPGQPAEEATTANVSTGPDRSKGGLKSLLKAKLDAADYVIKHLNTATQIRANNANAYAKIQKLLQDEKINFYTYINDGPKFKKFVLYGLYEESIAEIKSCLKEYGLDPVEIKQMQRRIQTPNAPTNYLVYFDAECQITLHILKEVKYICSTVISWAHYRQPSNNCLQCRNCFRFKHSRESCHMPSSCLYCAGKHPTETCALLKTKEATKARAIPEHQLRCCNCNGNHTAVYKHCPVRLQLIQKQQQPPQRLHTAPRKFIDAPTPAHNPWTTNYQQFPPLNNTAPTQTPNPQPVQLITEAQLDPLERLQNSRTPSNTRSRSTADPHPVYNRTLMHNNGNDKVSLKLPINLNPNSSSFNSNTSTYNRNCLTPQELMEVFQEIIGSISTCTSREEQLNAIMKIAIKYISPCQV